MSIRDRVSLSVPCQVRENHCFPTFVEGESPVIKSEQMAHPLLPQEQAVPNPVDLRAKTCIITGSNMSGKTTYLRTLGVNAFLAFAGGPVCAREFAISPMAVFTSMPVSYTHLDVYKRQIYYLPAPGRHCHRQ